MVAASATTLSPRTFLLPSLRVLLHAEQQQPGLAQACPRWNLQAWKANPIRAPERVGV